MTKRILILIIIFSLIFLLPVDIVNAKSDSLENVSIQFTIENDTILSEWRGNVKAEKTTINYLEFTIPYHYEGINDIEISDGKDRINHSVTTLNGATSIKVILSEPIPMGQEKTIQLNYRLENTIEKINENRYRATCYIATIPIMLATGQTMSIFISVPNEYHVYECFPSVFQLIEEDACNIVNLDVTSIPNTAKVSYGLEESVLTQQSVFFIIFIITVLIFGAIFGARFIMKKPQRKDE